MDIELELQRLQRDVAQQEQELFDLEAQVLDIEQELEGFTQRYDKLVRPLETKLTATEELIAELERKRYLAGLADERPHHSTWKAPEGYVSVADQFKRAWQQTANTAPPLIVPIKEEAKQDALSLKKLYRQLAARFHPDLTTDAAERVRRNEIMAKINEAYSQKDFDALQALMKRADTAPDQPLAALKVDELRKLRDQLAVRVQWLHTRKNNLLNGTMMDLKIESQLAAAQGRDLLAEMATNLKTAYHAAQEKLARLQRE